MRGEGWGARGEGRGARGERGKMESWKGEGAKGKGKGRGGKGKRGPRGGEEVGFKALGALGIILASMTCPCMTPPVTASVRTDPPPPLPRQKWGGAGGEEARAWGVLRV